VIAYVDTSVLLRVVLSQRDRLPEWSRIRQAVTSAMTEVECLRTLDRCLRQGLLAPEELAARRGLAVRLLERMDRVDVSPAVLRRAADPFPTPLGTLDAIHLATALLWRDSQEGPPEAGLVVLTHDAQLGTAATAMGFETRGS
jgi:predicted nucleic acid-binding protein